MSKHKIIRLILIFVAVLMVVAFFKWDVSGALSEDDDGYITIGFRKNEKYNTYYLTNQSEQETLLGGGYIYCIQHSGSLYTDVKNKYKVATKVTIVGNTATCGTTSINNPSNGYLAYILGGGTYKKGYGTYSNDKTTYSDRQKELWYYFNTWVDNVGTYLGSSIGSWKDGANSNLRESEGYR